MSATVHGRPIATSWTEYGCQFDDGEIYQGDDKEDAEFFVRLWGGKLIARNWYATGWLEVPGDGVPSS